MSKFALTVMISSLGLGTTLTFSSSNWLLAWMGLEINTLAIIPLMMYKHQPRAVEAATKYFIVQATAAAMVLFMSLMNAWNTGQWYIDTTDTLSSTVIIVALAFKLGMAPMHFWLPEVLQGLSFTMGLVLSTWQKLAPLALMIQVTNDSNPAILVLLGLTSSILGGWGGLNQTQTRKIMAYSSIAGMGWMIIVAQLAPNLTLIALTVYILTTSAAFITLNMLSAKNINIMSTAWSNSPMITATASLLVLSLGGLPPLTGFITKLLILEELTKQQLTAPALMMALIALISLYYYLRLGYSAAMTMAPQTTSSTTAWRTQMVKTPLPLALMTTMALGLLPMTTTFLAFLT
uniref:NADH-ubiquinone oxidoreductase chain 2 n=1 Tax=Esomus metallicus TaxID=353259 RepID=A0ZR66_9TELE|nr:NADH dehydrogenase subunit 2 [Esomus metallicus]BAF41546.1 ND2 [Esomus metallicus]